MAAILFADICGSTRLFEKYGDRRARQIETRVLDVLISGTVAHDGVVIKTIGDEIMSRFASAQQAVNAACEMHRALKEDQELAALNIAVKIGLHYGPVLVEKGDLFGDAVNVAARMVTLAKADQIITTRETAACLPADLAQTTRDLGRSWVRGKQDEVDIVEIIWLESTSLTQMAGGGQEELRSLLFARLILDYRGRTIEVVPGSQAFTMGRGERNNLVVDRELVSRSHADIEFRQNASSFWWSTVPTGLIYCWKTVHAFSCGARSSPCTIVGDLSGPGDRRRRSRSDPFSVRAWVMRRRVTKRGVSRPECGC
ncbi:MAG: adenylate/guanylate cyclase domain-containing protein [Candidatus Competibacteraceae bacterium]